MKMKLIFAVLYVNCNYIHSNHISRTTLCFIS